MHTFLRFCPLKVMFDQLRQLMLQIVFNFLFSRFIVQVDDKLYIYLEYVSGGSIYKLLQDYGQFGEIAIRSYTQQILSGLAYLHNKHTVHR
jgi:serine/threonine protein kinase